jgi:hypothetical protein
MLQMLNTVGEAGMFGQAAQMRGDDLSMNGPANPTPSAAVADYSGTYFIVPDNGMALEMMGNAVNAPIQMPFTNASSQRFRFERQSDGTYKIIVVATGKLLTSFWYWVGIKQVFAVVQRDDLGGRTLSEPSSISYTITSPHGTDSASSDEVYDVDQRWRITSVGNDQVSISSVKRSVNSDYHSGCLKTGSSPFGFYSVYNFINMSGENFGNTIDERFTLVPVSGSLDRLIPIANGTYRIQPRFKGGFLEIGGDPLYGNPQLAHNWKSAGSAQSDWRFERQSDWTYIITHVASNRVLASTLLPGYENRRGSALVVVKDRTNIPEECWYVTRSPARETSAPNTELSFYQLTNVKSTVQYKVGTWEGSKLEPWASAIELLHGWYRLVKQ